MTILKEIKEDKMASFDIPDIYDEKVVLHISDHAAQGSFAVFPWKLDDRGDPVEETPECIHIAWYKLADLLRWIGAKVEEPEYWRDPKMLEISIPDGDRYPRRRDDNIKGDMGTAELDTHPGSSNCPYLDHYIVQDGTKGACLSENHRRRV